MNIVINYGDAVLPPHKPHVSEKQTNPATQKPRIKSQAQYAFTFIPSPPFGPPSQASVPGLEVQANEPQMQHEGSLVLRLLFRSRTARQVSATCHVSRHFAGDWQEAQVLF